MADGFVAWEILLLIFPPTMSTKRAQLLYDADDLAGNPFPISSVMSKLKSTYEIYGRYTRKPEEAALDFDAFFLQPIRLPKTATRAAAPAKPEQNRRRDKS